MPFLLAISIPIEEFLHHLEVSIADNPGSTGVPFTPQPPFRRNWVFCLQTGISCEPGTFAIKVKWPGSSCSHAKHFFFFYYLLDIFSSKSHFPHFSLPQLPQSCANNFIFASFLYDSSQEKQLHFARGGGKGTTQNITILSGHKGTGLINLKAGKPAHFISCRVNR